MTYDRKITITVGNSRKSVNWAPSTLMLSEFYERCAKPLKSAETYNAFMALPKPKQDELKDVAGGFVGGAIDGPRRKAEKMIGHDLITLDFDNIPAWGADDVIKKVDELGCGYCIYSTRKHCGAKPRLRILVPTDRTMTPDEYEPSARKLAEMIGIDKADPTTFDASRLMYWPTICADGEYIYRTADKPLQGVDALLKKYADWRDFTQWPVVPGSVSVPKLAARQADPTEKDGIVGAFCRTYDIDAAIADLIPGVYIPVADQQGRYSYSGGSTTGGAVVYGDGKFLYSFHATDPCGGKLVNAFDLVRIHKFGQLDDTAAATLATEKLPSYKAMCDYAVADKKVSSRLIADRKEQAEKEFEDVKQEEDEKNWEKGLEVKRNGFPAESIDNCLIIMEHDPALKGKFAYNKFAGRGEVLEPVPWDAAPDRRLWSDSDNNGLYWYMETRYHIGIRSSVDSALSIHANKHSFNEVQDYIKGLVWDGVPRLDTLFIDYLGAADTDYNRAIARKSFTAAIARAMQPGIKHDCMCILCGPQGLGKSTLLDKMSRGWFCDSITSFEGKDASELLQGRWIIELGELDAFRHTDITKTKSFMSLRCDRYRAAYGRNVEERPRCCVFFGTCNQYDFLQDTTGNRRFWPIDVGHNKHSKSVWNDLDGEIDQIWAEAKMRWQIGEPLILSGAVEQEAQMAQEKHREVSPQEGMIIDFISKKIPDDWTKWSIDQRRIYWSESDEEHAKNNLVQRDRVCAAEIWTECLMQTGLMRKNDAREINNVLDRLEDWERTPTNARFGEYGVQRGYRHKNSGV